MPQPYPLELRWRAISLYEYGCRSVDEVSSLCGIDRSTLFRWVHEFHETGHLTPHEPTGGHPPVLEPSDMEVLLNFLELDATLYLDEMLQILHVVCQKDVSISTLCRTLRLYGITRKKLEKRYLERDELARRQYLEIVQTLPAQCFVFLDEVGKDDRSVLRRYGWAPSGMRAYRSQSGQRGVRYNLLAAISHQGVLAHDQYVGGCDGDRFYSFIVNLLGPHIHPFPGPNSIVVFDNAGFHLSPRVRAFIRSRGAYVFTVPSYSPDLNPIELSFAYMKTVLRRYSHDAQRRPAESMLAAYHRITSEMCAAWIRHCGYVFM